MTQATAPWCGHINEVNVIIGGRGNATLGMWRHWGEDFCPLHSWFDHRWDIPNVAMTVVQKDVNMFFNTFSICFVSGIDVYDKRVQLNFVISSQKVDTAQNVQFSASTLSFIFLTQ